MHVYILASVHVPAIILLLKQTVQIKLMLVQLDGDPTLIVMDFAMSTVHRVPGSNIHAGKHADQSVLTIPLVVLDVKLVRLC